MDDPDEYVEDSDEIEDVSATVLQQLIESTDSLAVLFCMLCFHNLYLSVDLINLSSVTDDDKDADSMEVLQELGLF